MNNSEQLEQVEISIEQAKAAVAFKEVLTRLTDNKDFKEIIIEGYFKEEASRLVLLKADPAMQGESEANQISKSIDAIGYLRLYLHTIMQRGIAMENSLKADENTREELLAEAL